MCSPYIESSLMTDEWNPLFKLIRSALDGDEDSLNILDEYISINNKVFNVIVSYSHCRKTNIAKHCNLISKLNNFSPYIYNQIKSGYIHKNRKNGLSAIIRVKNDCEYIKASILSIYKFVDEVICVLNNSTDDTGRIVKDLSSSLRRIRMYFYNQDIEPVGENYLRNLLVKPERSIARFYNYSISLSNYNRVIKWDGDMIATHEAKKCFEIARDHDVVFFNGYDIFEEDTTAGEPRIFTLKDNRFYVDVNNLEELFLEESNHINYKNPVYIHMKLAKENKYKKYCVLHDIYRKDSK